MPASASRLRLAGWSIIIGTIVFGTFMVLLMRQHPSQGQEAFNPADVGGWRYFIQLLLPWVSFAAFWIVLTTWKRIALAAKPTAFVKWTFDLLLIFAVISSLGGFLSILGIIPNDIWQAVSAKVIMPIDVILGIFLFFALGGISSKAMPLVYPMRWTMAFTLVATIIIVVMLIDMNLFTEAGQITLLLFAFLIIGLFAMVLFAVLLCVMFFKLARRAERTEQTQAEAPPITA